MGKDQEDEALLAALAEAVRIRREMECQERRLVDLLRSRGVPTSWSRIGDGSIEAFPGARMGLRFFPGLGHAIGTNPSTVRPRVFNLLAAGMLKTRVGASVYYLTQRGRVFLRIAALVSGGAVVGPELEFILRRLGLLAAGDSPDRLPELDPSRPFSGPPLRRLVDEIDACRDAFGIRISGGPYADDPTGRLIPGNPDWVER